MINQVTYYVKTEFEKKEIESHFGKKKYYKLNCHLLKNLRTICVNYPKIKLKKRHSSTC